MHKEDYDAIMHGLQSARNHVLAPGMGGNGTLGKIDAAITVLRALGWDGK